MLLVIIIVLIILLFLLWCILKVSSMADNNVEKVRK